MGDRVRNVIWPSLGWSRTLTYFKHRLGRLPGTPHGIACGFAHGAAISFTPFMGFHIIIAALFSWATRGNALAAAIGTVVGNPWTFPFIWIWIYELGHWLLGHGGATPEAVNFETFFQDMIDSVMALEGQYLLETVWPVFWPMFIGGLPTFVVVWIVFYLPLRTMVARYQSRRVERRQANRERNAA